MLNMMVGEINERGEVGREGSGWGVYEEGREICTSVQIKIRCIQ
jgi:hypothetical protein